jgi:GLPGLI family protein
MKAVFSFVVMFFATACSLAQSIQSYSITYEKKLNLANLYPRWRINDKEHKFYKKEFILLTNSEKSLYTRIEKPDGEFDDYFSSFQTYSNTYLDIKNRIQVSQKEVGEKTFLMKDSIPRLQWFIHDETKEIAGYTCIKAMAKLEDSIVLVAYFTDQLEASIGPESIGGLPGTILGLVVPKLHTTWLAKSVEKLELNPPKNIEPPVKGKPINSKELFKLAKEVFKEYETVNSIVWGVIL